MIISVLRNRAWLGSALLAFLAGGAALWLYTRTAAPWLTWAHDGADGGDLIAAAMTWGVPHPSGYPTYCLLGRLFALLPLGNVARRFNLFSATTAALAIALLSLTMQRALRQAAGRPSWREITLALIGAWAAACAPIFWSQAIIAEVYALNACFFAALLYITQRNDWLEHPRAWAALGLTFGLGLGAHLTLTLAIPGLAIMLWPRLTRRRALAGLLSTLLGLGVYLYLPMAARADPPINWGDPRAWATFWWVVSGKLYHGYALALPWATLPVRLGAWMQLWGQQYSWLGLALSLMGLGSWFSLGWRRRAWATLITFVLYSAYALLYDTADSYVYLIPTYLVAMLWLAEGARLALAMLLGPTPRRETLLTIAALLALLAIPGGSLARSYASLDLSRDRVAADWVTDVLRQAPDGALLITGRDDHTFALDYARWVENQRPDLCLVDGELLYQPWYIAQLKRRCPSLLSPGQQLNLETLITANLDQRPVYLTNERPELSESLTIEHQGALWKITGRR